MKLNFSIVWLVFFLFMVSCTGETSNPQATVVEEEEFVLLSDCVNDKYEVFLKELKKSIMLLRGCDEITLSYKKLSDSEVQETKKRYDELITTYGNDMSDSSITKKAKVFDEILDCQTVNTYYLEDKCSFYSGLIIHTDDMMFQFIRLFQEGEEEKFDFLLKVENGQPEVIAMG